MKHFFFAAVLCAALFPAVVPAYAAQIPVVAWVWENQEKTGLSGAAFSLSTSAELPGQTLLVTDETGRLVFPDLSEGTYYLHQASAPGLYLPLKKPVTVALSADGALSVEGRPAAEVSVMHRSGHHVLLIACAALSVFPMVARLFWLHRKNK